MMLIPTHIANTFNDARRYTRRYAKSFYFASHVLPKEKRNAAYAVYAFCRFADNLVDSESTDSIATRKDKIEKLRCMLTDIYNGLQGSGQGFKVFGETVERCCIPQQYFLDLLHGMEMDLSPIHHETFEDLQGYCYHVAGVVGLIMSCVFGVSNPVADRHANDLGTAMQLTNILRDVKEDFERGRIYLPRVEMNEYGISEATFAESSVDHRFRDFMMFQISRARLYYQTASDGLQYIPDDGSRYCVKLMGGIYGDILKEIEKQNFDVFSRRAVVSSTRKLVIAVSALSNTRKGLAQC